MTNIDFENLIADAIDDNVYAYAAQLDTHELLYLNKSFNKYLNITPNGVDKLYCYKVLHSGKTPCAFCTEGHIQCDKTYSRYSYKRDKNLHFICKDKIFQSEYGKTLIHTSYNISSEFEQIKNLKSGLLSNQLNKAIKSCAKTLLNEGHASINISKLLRIVCEYYCGVRANVYEYNKETNSVQCSYQFKDKNFIDIDDSTNKINVDNLASWWDILNKNDVVFIPSVSERFDINSIEYKLLSANHVTSCVISPIKINNKVTGFVIIDNPLIVYEGFELLVSASIFIANNLEKNIAVDNLKTSVNYVKSKINVNKILSECADILFRGNGSDDIINNILSKTCNYFDADRVALIELRENASSMINTYEFTNSYAEPMIEQLKDKHIPIPDFFYNDMINQSTFFFKIDDPNIPKDSVDYKFLSSINVPSMIVTGLLKKDKFAGLIAVHYPKKNIYNHQNEENRDILRNISGFILSELSKKEIIDKLKSLSFLDPLTGQNNRNYYFHSIEKYKKQTHSKLGIIFADINGLKRANDNLGHDYGDALIKWCGLFLAKYNPNSVFRIGGDEFVCFIEGMECEDFFNHIQKMRLELHNANLPNMSMGGTWSNGKQTIDQQISETDKIMYLEKQKYYILKQMMQINPETELSNLRILLDDAMKNNYKN